MLVSYFDQINQFPLGLIKYYLVLSVHQCYLNMTTLFKFMLMYQITFDPLKWGIKCNIGQINIHFNKVVISDSTDELTVQNKKTDKVIKDRSF